MIVIAIIGILAMIVGAPYWYLSDKQRLNTQKFRLEQLISQARSEARNGALFPWAPDEMSSIAIRITPTNTATSTDAKIDYLRYRPSSPNIYTNCEASSGSCSIIPVQLVDKKIKVAIIDTAWLSQTSTGYVIFEAPNASGAVNGSFIGMADTVNPKIKIQMGNDPTLIKDLAINP